MRLGLPGGLLAAGRCDGCRRVPESQPRARWIAGGRPGSAPNRRGLARRTTEGHEKGRQNPEAIDEAGAQGVSPPPTSGTARSPPTTGSRGRDARVDVGIATAVGIPTKVEESAGEVGATSRTGCGHVTTRTPLASMKTFRPLTPPAASRTTATGGASANPRSFVEPKVRRGATVASARCHSLHGLPSGRQCRAWSRRRRCRSGGIRSRWRGGGVAGCFVEPTAPCRTGGPATRRFRSRHRENPRTQKKRAATPRKGWLPVEEVRRRPTLPPRPRSSTIGAEGLSFRVRNGTGRFPFAMTAETLWSCTSREKDTAVPPDTAQWTRSMFVVKSSAY